MAEDRRVLIKIDLDSSELVKAAGVTRSEIERLKNEKKALDEKFKDNKASAEYNEALQKNSTQTTIFKNELQKQQKELVNLNKVKVEAVGSNEQMAASLSLATAKLNKMGVAQRNTTNEGQALQKEVLTLTNALKANESAVGNNFRNVGNYQGAIDKLKESIKSQNGVVLEHTTKLVSVQKEYTGMGFNAKKVEASTKDFTNQVADSTHKLEQMQTQLVQLEQEQEKERKLIGFTTNSVKTYANTVDGATMEIKDLEASMKTLDLGSKQFKESADRVSTLKLKVAQARGAVDEFGNKEPKNLVKKGFEDTADAAAGVVGATQLLTIAFGKNENAAAAQAKVLQLMAIQQAIVNVAKGAGAIKDLAEVVILKVKTAWQYLYTAAVGGTTGALKAMRLATAATGIGAFIVGIGILVAYLLTLKKTVREASALQKELGKNAAEAAINLNIEATKANVLFDALKKTNAGSVERNNLMTTLNKEYGTTLKNLSNEALFLNQVERAQRDVIKGIENKIKAKLVEADLELVLSKEAEILGEKGLANNRKRIAQEKLDSHISNINAQTGVDNEKRALEQSFNNLSLASDKADFLYKENQSERLRLGILFAKLAQTQTSTIVKQVQTTTKETNKKTLDDTIVLNKEVIKNLLENSEVLFDRQVIIANQEADRRKQTIQETITNEKQKAISLLEIELVLSKKLLTIATERADANKAISDEEQDNIIAAQLELDKVIDTLKKLKDVKEDVANTDGVFSPEDIAGMNKAIEALGQVQNVLGAIGAAINANASNQNTLLDQQAAKEKNNIENSLLSQSQKNKKLKELDKKLALDKYKIELETFRANKALNIVNAIISAAAAVLQGFAQLGPIGGAIAAAVTAVTSGIQIGIIASQPEPTPPLFYDGGFTEKSGNPRRKSMFSNNDRTLHHNEYVTPHKVLRLPQAQPHISALEGMRKNTPGSLNLSGFADGGLTARGLAGQQLTANDIGTIMANHLKNLPSPIVSVIEIDRVRAGLNKSKAKATA